MANSNPTLRGFWRKEGIWGFAGSPRVYSTKKPKTPKGKKRCLKRTICHLELKPAKTSS
jgi:hypothetical protein